MKEIMIVRLRLPALPLADCELTQNPNPEYKKPKETERCKISKTKIKKENKTEGKIMKQFNRDEQSLLMYFETCIVDHFGKVAGVRMNEDDYEIAKKWNDEGFISFGRIPFHDIKKNTPYPATHQVKFSDEAWKLAHQFRRERGERHVETINAKQKVK